MVAQTSIKVLFPFAKLLARHWQDNLISKLSPGAIEVERRNQRNKRLIGVLFRESLVVTIHGIKATLEIIDLAFAIERPIFPIPFTGRLSLKHWRKNRKIIQEWFGISDALADELESVILSDMNEEEIQELAEKVVKLLLNQLRQRCFIIMPFYKYTN
jgi:hypothetical protein